MTILGGLFACTPQDAATTDAATQSAVAGNAAVTPQDASTGGAQVQAKVVKPVADPLFVFDENLVQLVSDGTLAPSFRTTMSVYQRQLWPDATWVPISGWEGLFALLMTYSRIPQLIIFSHAVSGSLGMTIEAGTRMLDGSISAIATLDFAPLTMVAEQLVTEFGADALPTVDEWRFEGCHVGNAPNDMAAFKTAFRSTRVVGYNLYHGLGYLSLASTYPDHRSAEQYAAAVAAHGSVPPRGSPLYLPGLGDLSESIGGQNFEQTMWEYFETDTKPPVQLARNAMKTTVLTAAAAAKVYAFDKPKEAHQVIVEG